MNIADILLNNVYCMSKDAACTVSVIKSHPLNSNNFLSFKLYSLLNDLNEKTFALYRDLTRNFSEDKLYQSLSEILVNGSDIEITYEKFIISTKLPNDHILMKKLKSQVDNTLLMLTILSHMASKEKATNHADSISR